MKPFAELSIYLFQILIPTTRIEQILGRSSVKLK